MDIKKIYEYIKEKNLYLKYNFRLYDIFNNNLTPYLRERLRTDLKGENSASEAESRLSVINIVPKLVEKLAQAYVTADVKTTSTRQPVADDAVKIFGIDEARQRIDSLLNLSRCVAVEPIYDAQNPLNSFIRVLPAHSFLVYSDDAVNPERVTHFIKILENKDYSIKYAIYTNEFYYECEDDKILIQQENPYGVIPFVYIKTKTYELMPPAPIDDYEMITLLPLMLTDGNYALKYQAFSIIYALNASIQNLTLAPNAVWFLESTGQEGDKPELGTIKPTLNIDDLIKNINVQYSFWLDSKGLKNGNITENISMSNISGIAKVIDDADVSATINKNRKTLAQAERKIFELIEIKTFGAMNISDATTRFEEHARVPEMPKEKLERIILKYEKGFTTLVDAIKEINNFASNEEAEAYIELIAEEKASKKPDVKEVIDVQGNDEVHGESAADNKPVLQRDDGERDN